MTLGPTPEQAVKIKKVEHECTDHSTSHCTVMSCMCTKEYKSIFMLLFYSCIVKSSERSIHVWENWLTLRLKTKIDLMALNL